MKDLTLSPRVQDWEFSVLERDLGAKIPGIIQDFLKRYAGLAVQERMFRSEAAPDGAFYINEFLSFTEIHSVSKGRIEEGENLYLAFAIDPNGAYYFISLNEDKFLSVSVLAIDLSPELTTICDSFDEFINRLEIESSLA